METPVINNHLKRPYILFGKKTDIDSVTLDLQQQGETARYLCCIDCVGKEYISVEKCIEMCLRDSNIEVWNVSENCEPELRLLQSKKINVINLGDLFACPDNRACHYGEMYIDRYGNVHCCCKTYLNNVIGNLREPDIADKIINYSPKKDCVCSKGKLTSARGLPLLKKPELASIELSSLCNAHCTYCFQNDENKGDRYKYYDELLDLINKLGLEKLIFAGGEILMQPESIDFIRKIRKTIPNAWIHLKANGCHDLEKIYIVEELFDSITITLNGFSNSTVSTIMNVSFDKIRAFCEEICNRKKVAVGVKYLASPANICEVPDFIDWSTNLNPDRIIISCARIYDCKSNLPTEWMGSSFSGLNNAFWTPVFRRIGKRVIDSLNHKIGNGIQIQVDNELKYLLNMSDAIGEFNHGG